MEAKQDMAGIVERLEAASGPDRELDEAIALTVLKDGGTVRLMGQPDDAAPIKMFEYENGSRGTALAYSRSIDAALSLVPEGFSYELMKSAVGEFSRARLWDWKRGPLAFDPDNNWVSEGNRSLAINLVIAALRARAHKGEG